MKHTTAKLQLPKGHEPTVCESWNVTPCYTCWRNRRTGTIKHGPTHERWRMKQDHRHQSCSTSCSTSSPVIPNPLLLHLHKFRYIQHSMLFYALPTSRAKPPKRSIWCREETKVLVRSPPKWRRRWKWCNGFTSASIHLLENYPLNNLETLGNFSTKRMPILAESSFFHQTVWDPEVPLVIETQTFIKLERRVKTHQQLSKDMGCFSYYSFITRMWKCNCYKMMQSIPIT